MYEFETLIDLKKAIDTGKLNENLLVIVLDNYCTSFYYGECEDDHEEEIDNEIHVEETNGYEDIEPLYKLAFPKAIVEWC